MRFLGGFLKFLAILVMIIATAACTWGALYLGGDDAVFDMILIWIIAMLPSLIVLGLGSAMTQVVKLRKRVEQLEARLFALQAIPAYQPSMYRPAAAENPQPEGPEVPQPQLQEPVYQPPVATEVTPAPAKKSRIWIPIVAVVLVAVIGIAAVIAVTSGGREDAAPVDKDNDEILQTEESEETSPNVCPMTINGICVDDSFVAEDGSSLKMVYLFYTLTAQDTNLSIDSKYTTMYIGGNAYESDHFADAAAACKFTPNYYYSSYIRDVYVGESVNVVATFYIPLAELDSGEEVRFADHQIPGIESITMTTGDFFRYGSPEDIAWNMDTEGYEHIQYLREPADEATVQLVSSQLNNYYWSFYVNNTSYKLQFWAPNNFSVTTAFGVQYGTYTVQNGYVFCTYPSNGYTVEIPYEIIDGKLDLDTIGGFDVRG